MRPHLRLLLLRHLPGRTEDAHRYGCNPPLACHLVGRARGRQEEREIRRGKIERGRSLHARSAWLVEGPRRNGRLWRMKKLEIPTPFTGEGDRLAVEGAH